jgi:hypothetical protein
MIDDKTAAASAQEASAPRCPEMVRTDRGWERCHRDEHSADTRHHVRDRSWSTAENTPRLQFGQPCTSTCHWPDQVQRYRGSARARHY